MLYLAAGVVALGCYLAVPPFVGRSWLFELVGLSSAIAIAVGTVRYRPSPRLPWVLFTVAQLVFVAGDFFYYTYDLSFPSFADGLYIVYYPLQAAGLVLLVRSRTPDKDSASLLDALIITVGLGLLSWIYLIEPYTRHTDESLVSRIVSMSYPAMDVLLLAVAVRLVMGTGTRPRAFRLLFASILCLIATDATYGAIELHGSYSVGSALDVGWMTAYLLWGAAALDPSMRDLSSRAPAPATGGTLTGRRVLLLAAATLIAPATLLMDDRWPIDGFDVTVAAGTSAVMFVLVLARMLGLVSSLRAAVARHEQAEQRETVLRHAATALAAAPDREHVRRAAVDGARALVGGLPAVDISVEICDGTTSAAASSASAANALVVPLSTQASSYGRLVVAPAASVPADVVDGLHTLGAQVALALEGAALTDDLSRQHSDARVGALVQNSSEMILVLDPDLVVRYATPSVARAIGHRPEDLVGTSLTSLHEPNEQIALRTFFSKLARHPGRTVHAEWRMRRSDGLFTDVEAICTNLLDDHTVRGIVVTAHDITDRKVLEAGLQRQVRELEELDRIRSEFVATVSHELRTPLTSIIGEVELLGEGELGELTSAQVRGVDMIGRNSARLLSLIEDLLTLSHMETSTLQLHLEPTPVQSLIEAVRSEIDPVAAAKPVAFEVRCYPGSGTVVVDRDQLDRALLNLLTNAVKFTPPGGSVSLEAQREHDHLVFRVSDTGVGVPEEEQGHLFTRFFRSSVATQLAIQGTGLGLVIVKRIVEEHGGTISMVSTPGRGTTVTVRIPAGDHRDTSAAA